jgi:hypothetical protein
MRRFYLHIRHNGVFYVELVDPQTGRKLTARSRRILIQTMPCELSRH